MDEPLINGFYYSFASIELTWNGRVFRGFKSINYDHGKEPGAVRGSHPQKIGRTRGDYDATGDAEVYKPQWLEFLAEVGDGFMDIPIDLVVSYAEAGQPVTTDTVKGCLIKKSAQSHSQGTDALVHKIDLDPMYILEDDKKPIDNFLE